MPKSFGQTKKITTGYWVNRDERAKHAASHHEEMNSLYSKEIDNSIKKSKIYSTKVNIDDCSGKPKQIFKNITSADAVFDNEEQGKICLLNFASYKNPGGYFMGGSSAQEESLCHESTLYEVISSNDLSDYYAWNNKNLNRALYLNRAIYSPDILFIKGDKVVKCDVLTCAAPNMSVAHRYCKVGDEENYEVLKDRMQFIADIMNVNMVNIAVLGAFGCGVFGQFPEDVANLWKELNYGKDMKLIIHPIPNTGKNVDAFRETFK